MRNSIVGVTALAVILLASVVVLALPQNSSAAPCKPGQTNKQCINGERRIRNIHNIDQLNEAIAQQNGGDVAQNQLNAANLQGDHFNIHQKNKAVSEGADSSFQNQFNDVNIEGDHNNIHQSNDAKSDADNSVIVQGNNADTEGDHNNVHQKNKAEQTGGGSQSVSQSNTANSNSDNED